MKKSILFFSAIALTCMMGAAAAGITKGVAKLTASGSQASYQCTGGKKLAVAYYVLSDDSLAFVKLTVGGQKLTLPQVISASGERYSDGRTEWWIKGNEGSFDATPEDNKPAELQCKVAKSSAK